MLKFGNTFVNFGGTYLKGDKAKLAPYTIRLQFKEGVTPSFNKGTPTQISQSPNVWDLTYENNNWESLFVRQENLTDILDANLSNVSSLYDTFNYCYALSSVALFDTSRVKSMTNTFHGCSFINVPLFDTSNVEYMERTFTDCTKLKTLPLFDTSKVKNMGGMLQYCRSLTSVPNFDTSNVTSMWGMLRYTKITSVPDFDTSNVTAMNDMLGGCSQLKSLPLFDTSKVTNMDRMCYDCTNVSAGALALYQQASTQTTPPSNHSQAFYNCGVSSQTGSAELAQIPSDWK